jgi:hypothetical protein
MCMTTLIGDAIKFRKGMGSCPIVLIEKTLLASEFNVLGL